MDGLDRMRRRATLSIATALIVAARGAVAQAATGKRRIALLSISSPAAAGPFIASFVSGLRELGWSEGNNLILDARFAQGDAARYAPLTSELLALRPDIFVSTADFAVLSAAAATKTVPIVFVYGTDPVGRGLVKSLAKPGGNVTGFATLDKDLFAKRLELLKEAIPGLVRVGVLVSSSASQLRLDDLEEARRKLHLEFVPALINQSQDIDPAFEKFAAMGVKGVLDYAEGGTVLMARDRVATLAIKHRMGMLGLQSNADSSVLLTYGADVSDLFKRAALLVDRILRGAKPEDIVVEQVNVYELIVNLRTARAIGLDVSRSLLLRATRVVE